MIKVEAYYATEGTREPVPAGEAALMCSIGMLTLIESDYDYGGGLVTHVYGPA